MHDLIIIGGGPAGLTATIYAIRKRLDCLLISPDLGGKANARMDIEGADAFQVINGSDTVRRFRTEIEYLEFARLLDRVQELRRTDAGFSLSTAGGKELSARSVLLATGAAPVLLDVPGAEGFFLRGLSYSTVSYAPLYLGKAAAVLGNTTMALRGAAELAQIARQVYLIGASGEVLDSPLGRHLQSLPWVTVLALWQVAALRGEAYLREISVQGPQGQEQTLAVDVLFVEQGLIPHSSLVRGLADLDEAGHVIVNAACETSQPGLFAAGDVTHRPVEQVLVAIGEGAKAALSAYEYLLLTRPA